MKTGKIVAGDRGRELAGESECPVCGESTPGGAPCSPACADEADTWDREAQEQYPAENDRTAGDFPELSDPMVRAAIDGLRAGVTDGGLDPGLSDRHAEALNIARAFVSLESTARELADEDEQTRGELSPLFELLGKMEDRLLRASICGTADARASYLLDVAQLASQVRLRIAGQGMTDAS